MGNHTGIDPSHETIELNNIQILDTNRNTTEEVDWMRQIIWKNDICWWGRVTPYPRSFVWHRSCKCKADFAVCTESEPSIQGNVSHLIKGLLSQDYPTLYLAMGQINRDYRQEERIIHWVVYRIPIGEWLNPTHCLATLCIWLTSCWRTCIRHCGIAILTQQVAFWLSVWTRGRDVSRSLSPLWDL